MTNTSRIYLVQGPDNSQHLVKAITRAQALARVVNEHYTVAPASAVEVAELVGDGQKVLGMTPVAAPDASESDGS